MENVVLRRGTSASNNFNNMTDEQLQEWHTAVLTEAQRENYVNHNLEIVRHYRTEAISRAPAFDIERNAIDAAIARHGLYVSNPGGSESSGAGAQEEVQPPPLRRPRMEQLEQPEQPEQPEQQQQEEEERQPQLLQQRQLTIARGSFCGHDAVMARIVAARFAERGYEATGAANSNARSTGANGNNNNHNNNNNNEPDEAEINEKAIKASIDSLGLPRT